MPVNHVITITNRKGGSGKTTTSVNLAAALAKAGHRVLLVDADTQGHSALSLGMPRGASGDGLFDVLTGRVHLNEAARPSALPNLLVLPAGRLAGLEEAHGDGRKARTAMLEYVARQAGEYRFVIIDTPPMFGVLTIGALIASSWVVVPMQAHFLAMEGLAETVRILKRIEALYSRKVELLGVVPTFYQAHVRLSQAIIDDIRKTLGERIILPPVRTNIALAEAPGHGRSIFEYDPGSNGARDYLRLAGQVEALTGVPRPMEQYE